MMWSNKARRGIVGGLGVLLMGGGIGCHGTYQFRIQPNARIDTCGVASESPGRTLRMWIVCLSEKDLKTLKDRHRPTLAVDSPLTDLTADRWFDEKLHEDVRKVVREDALCETDVRPGEPQEITLKHPAPWGKNSWFLVFADFACRGEHREAVCRLDKRKPGWGKERTIIIGDHDLRWGD